MNRMTTIALVPICLALVAGGCHTGRETPTGSYETIAADPQRDTQAARKHNAASVILLKDDCLDQAEARLKTALKADLFFGPAHNNLGTVYYRQKKFYLAAWEFQYAAKLMPTKAEPRRRRQMVRRGPDPRTRHRRNRRQPRPPPHPHRPQRRQDPPPPRRGGPEGPPPPMDHLGPRKTRPPGLGPHPAHHSAGLAA